MAGVSNIDKIKRLIAFHERTAEGLRLALAAIEADDQGTRAVRQPSVLAQAMADESARNGNGAGHTAAPATFQSQKEMRRQRTAEFLAQLSTDTPGPLPGNGMRQGLGSLIRNGYVKKVRGKYLRTAKAFTVSR